MNFDEANDYIKSRVSKTTALGSKGISETVPAKIRAHCFYSARVADDRILTKIREVSDAVSGGSLSQSEAAAKLRLWLRAEGQDNGSKKITNLASKARVDLILSQNQKMAVAVGKYAKDRDPVVEERFPSWQYHCGRNARDAHGKLDGKVFLKSDPIWRQIYPPWEFNCNCWVTNSDENPSPPLKPEDEPKPPASGYAFNPADAFEDYKVDDYQFDTRSEYVEKARTEAQKLEKDDLKRLYKDAEQRQPGIIKQADDFWNDLKPEEKEAVLRYTASDQLDLNRASRGAVGITDTASEEMDRLSAVLEKAPKYTGGQVYRVINLPDDESFDRLKEDLDKSIWGLSGFNSTSLSMDAAKNYANDKALHKIVFHIVKSRNGAFIGHHSWTQTDKEVLFDRKCKFRALKPWEDGYIKDTDFDDGFIHIALVEV